LQFVPQRRAVVNGQAAVPSHSSTMTRAFESKPIEVPLTPLTGR
jgi:hypothetical protein